jgi:SET family sugar efflux transporter-like MFS transporter
MQSKLAGFWISPVMGILSLNIFFAGAGNASTFPFRAIVGVEVLGLSNMTYAVVMAINAFAGAAAGVALGWLSDKINDRRWLVILCAFVGALGFGLVWLWQSPFAFITAYCLLLPFSNALFSQGFSYSRAFLDQEIPDQAELMLSFLRTIFTVAWVVVPPIAGWLAVQNSSFSVFAFACGTHISFTLLFGLLWTQPSAKIGKAANNSESDTAFHLPKAYISNPYRVGIAGVILGSVALQLNITVLPLVIMQDLGGTLEQVGINASVAAAVEVPFMLAWGYLALRMRKETILASSSVILALYLGLMSVAESVLQVLLLQGLAALAIAALLSINISYLQEAIKGRLGLSTSLVDVNRVLSTLGASAVFALHQGDLYAPLMEIAAIISLGGAGLMIIARKLQVENKAG